MLKKKVVIEYIQAYLADQIRSAPHANEERNALERQLLMYRLLPQRDFSGEGEVVCPGALVELKINDVAAHYFVAPSGGGLIANVEGRPVQVISVNSPLAEAILGKKEGDTAQVEVGGKVRSYEVLSIR